MSDADRKLPYTSEQGLTEADQFTEVHSSRTDGDGDRVKTPASADPITHARLLDILAAMSLGTAPILERFVADGNLSGHVLVRNSSPTEVVRATADAPGDDGYPIFMTTEAALDGASVTVLALGKFEEATWTWTAGEPIFLGANGVMMQTVPTYPAFEFLLEVALAMSATEVFFNPKMPIDLI